MKKPVFLQTVLTFIFLSSFSTASVFLGGGISYIIDDSTYLNAAVILEDMGTHADVIGPARVNTLYAYDTATINMSGGHINYYLKSYDEASITLAGGSVEYYLASYNNSRVLMTGGSVGHLKAYDNTEITISVGSVENNFAVFQNGKIYIDGYDIRLNGTLLVNGDKLSDFGVFSEGVYKGAITGKWHDGTSFSADIWIDKNSPYAVKADIMIIPEPAAMALLGLGTLILRKK